MALYFESKNFLKMGYAYRTMPCHPPFRSKVIVIVILCTFIQFAVYICQIGLTLSLLWKIVPSPVLKWSCWCSLNKGAFYIKKVPVYEKLSLPWSMQIRVHFTLTKYSFCICKTISFIVKKRSLLGVHLLRGENFILRILHI